MAMPHSSMTKLFSTSMVWPIWNSSSTCDPSGRSNRIVTGAVARFIANPSSPDALAPSSRCTAAPMPMAKDRSSPPMPAGLAVGESDLASGKTKVMPSSPSGPSSTSLPAAAAPPSSLASAERADSFSSPTCPRSSGLLIDRFGSLV